DEISRVLDQIEQILGARGKRVNKESIMAELSQIRKNGYALSFGEVNPGTVAIGSPVFDYKGRVTASIGIMGPENRFSPDEMPVKIKNVKKSGHSFNQEHWGSRQFRGILNRISFLINHIEKNKTKR
ncbi:IclR family transcriptional regulator domain-containing protein, partial [Desulfoscipio geothermicus]